MKNLCEPMSETSETSKQTGGTHSLSTCAWKGASGAGRRPIGWQPMPRFRGWILYDGDCRFCLTAAQRFDRFFNSRGFVCLPLQTPWVQSRLGLTPAAPLEEMRVLTATGEDFGGAEAVLFLTGQVWYLRPLASIGKLPLLHSALNAAYRWIAAHRGCDHQTCSAIRSAGPKERRSPVRRTRQLSAAGRTPLKYSSLPASKSGFPAAENAVSRRTGDRRSLRRAMISWTPLVLLPTSALIARAYVEPWVFMWCMVGAIFLGSKWLTLQRATPQGRQASIGRQFAYLFLYGGMDARPFLGPARTKKPLHVIIPQLAPALAKIALGALLFFGVARHLGNDLLAGWTGMIGVILIAHFGLFELATIWWQMRGLTARPIMNAPWKSSQLSEFWGHRWNRAFQQLVIDTLFRPFANSLGVVRATLITFFISGLLHELVISLPAGAGYGLPTSYFLLQGWGLIAQRTPMPGRAWFHNRFFTLFLVAIPAFGLFHPPFVRGVIVPFMHAIGAL